MPSPTLSDESLQFLRDALSSALLRGATIPHIAQHAHIGTNNLSSFAKGGRIGRETADKLVRALNVSLPVTPAANSEPLWSAAVRYRPDEIWSCISPTGVRVIITRKGAVVLDLHAATTEAACIELRRLSNAPEPK